MRQYLRQRSGGFSLEIQSLSDITASTCFSTVCGYIPSEICALAACVDGKLWQGHNQRRKFCEATSTVGDGDTCYGATYNISKSKTSSGICV